MTCNEKLGRNSTAPLCLKLRSVARVFSSQTQKHRLLSCVQHLCEIFHSAIKFNYSIVNHINIELTNTKVKMKYIF